MFSPNKVNSPLSSSFEEPVFQNQKQIKNKQSRYFNDEYQKSINMKQQRLQQQKMRKKQELQLYNKKNEQYLNAVAMSRSYKQQQKQFMAEQYDQMINFRKYKQLQEKKSEKIFQKQLLAQPTWIRDRNQERQSVMAKKNRYNQQLSMHVKAQQQRIASQQEMERQRKQKINEQAQIILRKEIEELQQRQRRKNLFEQRQNGLLGTGQSLDNGNSYGMSNSKILEQIGMRKRQQELYGLGLQIQRKNQERRKKKESEPSFLPGQYYNPITNPIPVVYKNPNVLRMLNQK